MILDLSTRRNPHRMTIENRMAGRSYRCGGTRNDHDFYIVYEARRYVTANQLSHGGTCAECGPLTTCTHRFPDPTQDDEWLSRGFNLFGSCTEPPYIMVIDLES
jgi:hypothetical protein